MALLQAWPGRGYWQGRGGTLTGMVQAMAKTPQPGFLSSWLTSFGSFDAAHGWAVNLFAVVALAVIGASLVSGRRRVVRIGLIALVVLSLADWVLIEDLGFLGGVGTDPNSMLPMCLLFIAGYVAMVRVPAQAEALAGGDTGTAVASSWWSVPPCRTSRARSPPSPPWPSSSSEPNRWRWLPSTRTPTRS